MLPALAIAATYAQSDASTLGGDSIGPQNNGDSGYLYQGIGTGFSGTLDGLIQQFKQTGGGNPINAQGQIIDCPTQADWLAQTGCTGYSPISENVSGTFFTYTYSPIAMNPSDYYGIFDGFNLGAGPSISAYGSVSPISDGACYIFDNSHDTPPLNTGGSACNTIAAPYFQLQGTGGNFVSNNLTQILAVTPANGVTVSTSTAGTVGANVYISTNDANAGNFVQIQYAPYVGSQTALASPQQAFTTIRFPITGSGYYNLSTTSAFLTVGKYTMQTTIQTQNWLYNILNIYGLGSIVGSNVLTASSTNFIVQQLNGYDIFQASTTQAIQDYLASSTISLASCSSFTSFNLGDCLNLLFVPQSQATLDVVTAFKQQFLSYEPWGYVTRFITILTTGGTTTLPSITATVAMPYSSGGPDDSQTFTFDEQGMVTGAAAALDGIDANGTSLNWRDILEPYEQLFIAITLMYIIIHDLIGTARHNRNNFR